MTRRIVVAGGLRAAQMRRLRRWKEVMSMWRRTTTQRSSAGLVAGLAVKWSSVVEVVAVVFALGLRWGLRVSKHFHGRVPVLALQAHHPSPDRDR